LEWTMTHGCELWAFSYLRILPIHWRKAPSREGASAEDVAPAAASSVGPMVDPAAIVPAAIVPEAIDPSSIDSVAVEPLAIVPTEVEPARAATDPSELGPLSAACS